MDSAFSTAIPDSSLAVIEQLSENSRLGIASRNPAQHRGIAWSKSTLALGLPEWSGKTASDSVVAANNGTPTTPVVQQDNGKSKPNVPPEWGFCSAYRDGTGAGDAMYHLCMSFPNGPWYNCVRGNLLNQWTPNPNPFQLVWYLGPDHAYDFATCALH